MACDPNTLLEQAKCFITCIPPGMYSAANMALLCQIAENTSGGGGGGLYVLKAGDTMTGALHMAQPALVASDPAIDIVQTWNNGAVAFNALLVSITNTASAGTASIFEGVVDGVSRFSVRRTGTVMLHRQAADTVGETLNLSKRGTTGSATAAIASGDTLSSIETLGWDGTSQASTTVIRTVALEAFTLTAHGTRIDFGVPAIGAVVGTTRFTIAAAEASLVNGTRFVITRGTVTADLPSIDMTETWNNVAVSFSGIKLNVTNTASAAGTSFLLNLQTGSVTVFSVDVGGNVAAGFVLAAFKDTSTNTSPVALEAYHSTTSGTPTTSNGVSIDMRMDSNTTTRQIGARLSVEWTDATHATRTSRLNIRVTSSGSTVTPVVISPTAFNVAAGAAYQLNGVALLNPLTVYAAGTAYTLTATSAAVDFGTTDPIITVNAAGTYLIRAKVKVNLVGATFAANQTLTVKLRRTNNTATDLTNSTTTWTLPIVTTQTNTLAVIDLPEVAYTTALTNDTIQLFADVSVLPSAGTVTIAEASIVAIRTS